MEKFKGSLDSFENSIVRGWAMSPENSEEKLELSLFIDDVFLQNIKADNYRSDLLQFGDGHYAFKAEVLEPVNGTTLHIRDKESLSLISSLELTNNALEFIGNLDDPKGRYVYGWAKCTSSEEPVSMDFFVNNEFVSKVETDFVREDLVKYHGKGLYGFRIRMPEEYLTGRMYELKLVSENVDVVSGTFVYEPHKWNRILAGKIAKIKGGYVSGWAMDKNNLGEPLYVEFLVDDELVYGQFTDEKRGHLQRIVGESLVGYSVNLSEFLNDGDAHKVQMVVEGKPVDKGVHYRGRICHIEGDVSLDAEEMIIKGWVCNRFNAGNRLKVEMFQDEDLLGLAAASEFKADLLEQDIGDGHYGFHLDLKGKILEKKNISLSVVVAGEVLIKRFNLLGSDVNPEFFVQEEEASVEE